MLVYNVYVMYILSRVENWEYLHITSTVIWIKTRLPLFVVTGPKTTSVHSVAVPALFAATASAFEELTIGNCGANQGGQTCPKHPETIINSCSSALRSEWFSQVTACGRFLLSSSENIQSPSSAHPIVFNWHKFGCCADVFELGFQVSSTCLLLWLSLISVTLDFDLPMPLPLPRGLGGCLYQQSAALCPYFPQFRHSPSKRECSAVVSPWPLPEWLSFPFLPPFLPLPDFPLPFLAGKWHRFLSDHLRVCFQLKSSWRCVSSSIDL